MCVFMCVHNMHYICLIFYAEIAHKNPVYNIILHIVCAYKYILKNMQCNIT